jgi:hypothetical protein
MWSPWFIKGMGYLLIAVLLGIALWVIRLRPEKVRKRRRVMGKGKPVKKRRRK